MRNCIVFVYNADSGLYNTVTDIAHKLLSPSTYKCNLCALTHDTFKVRETWVDFLKTLDADCIFLHRDEFIQRYGKRDVPLPVVFMQDADELRLIIDASRLNQLASLGELKKLLLKNVQKPLQHSQNTIPSPYK